jgi:excisionase family DNA binding protein
MNNAYLRPKQLAEWLNVSPRQVRYWQAERVIPFIKVGKTILFDPNKVQAALSRFERNTGVAK